MSTSYNFNPVFIIGAGRSGTKFFRDTLLASNQTYAIPYDINYIWRFGNESHPDDELLPEQASENTVRYIRNTINSLARKQNSGGLFLLEKTVSNGLRIEFLLKVFPNAKFIHLLRDGRAVAESSLRMWHSPPEPTYLLQKLKYFPWRNYRYALRYAFNLVKGKVNGNRGQDIWGPKYKGIDEDLSHMQLLEVCATQWLKCVTKTIDSLQKLPEERSITIKYEDLVASPDSLDEVIKFIGLSDVNAITEYYDKHLRVGELDKWKKRLKQEDQKLVMDLLNETLSELAYR